MNNIFQKPFIRKTIYVIIGFFIFLAIINYIIMPFYVSADEVKVPKVQKLKLNEAIKLLEDANLNVLVGDTSYDKKYPEGTIILQKPVGGEIVKEGRTIFLVVSGGEPYVSMPQLRGKSVRDAKLTLERLGLKVGEIVEVQSNNPKDVVVDQQYAPNVKVKGGKSVSISISLGSTEGDIAVPDLIGKSLAEATRILHEKLLRVGKINYQPSFSVLPNTVLDQYPVKGNMLNENDAVDLFITKNVEPNEEVK